MNKTVAIYLGRNIDKKRVFDNQLYEAGYLRLARMCKEAGITLIYIRGSRNESQEFDRYWGAENDDFIPVIPCPIDLIFIKNGYVNTCLIPGDRVVIHPELSDILDDKWATFNLFRDYSTPTIQVEKEPIHYLNAFETDKVVFKPVDAYGGSGIEIVERTAEKLETLHFDKPYLVQPFIDTSAGIPGIMTGHHDLRIVIHNGAIVTAYIRKPAPGSLLANISLGGSAMDLHVHQIPAELPPLVKEIDEKLKQYGPRIYSIDFLYSDGKPLICELNCKPGFPIPQQSEEFHQLFLSAHVELFQEALLQDPFVKK